MSHLLNLKSWSIRRSSLLRLAVVEDASELQQICFCVSLTDRHFVTSIDSAVELLTLCILGVELDVVDKNSIAAIRSDQAMQVGQFRPVSTTSLDFFDAFGVKIDHDATLGYSGV